MVAKYHQSFQHFEKQNLSTQSSKIKSAFLVFSLLAFVGIAVVYLLQITFISEQGILNNSLEKQISQLRQENEKLALQAVSLQSMSALQTRIDNLQMVPSYQVAFLDSQTFVAKK